MIPCRPEGDHHMAGRRIWVAAGACAIASSPLQAETPSSQVRAVAAAKAVAPALSRAPTMLGTAAIPIRAERFVLELARARQDGRSHPAIQRLVAPAVGLKPLDKL